MTVLQICAIRDRAIDAFGQPIFVTHTGAAVRSFADEINNQQSELAKHPEDYDLYHLGTYDAETGAIESHKPRQLAIGKDQVKPLN